MKCCYLCEEKPARPNQGTCKECHAGYMRKYRKTIKGKEVTHKSAQNYRQNHPDRLKERAKASRQKRMSDPASREKWNTYQREYKTRYLKDLRERAKHFARTAVHYAILTKKLKRGRCSVCNSSKNIQGHHEDYAKPLDVVWLCVRHHVDLHVEKKQLASAPV